MKQGIKIKRWLGYFDFAIFWNEYDNYVEYIPGLYENMDEKGNPYFPDLGARIFGLHPENVEEARIFGFEASIGGTGKIGPVKITPLVGYTYTYPGNLESDSTADIGGFLKKAFKNFARRIPADDPDSEGLLFFRSRHIVRGDISIEYKRFSAGYSIYYSSFPEKIPALFVLATTVLDGGQGTLQKYIDNHQNGDLVMDARIGYEITKHIRMSFLVKNLTNWEYSSRPGKLEAPRNFTLQFRFKF